MQYLKIGVAGVGHLGRVHTKLWKEVDAVELVGLYDENRAIASAVANEYKTQDFDSLEALLDNVDAVSIVTPTQSHYAIAEAAIARGKHVLIEKPMTTTTEQAKSLIEQARTQNVKIQVGHVERFNPALLAAEPYLNDPRFFESHRMAQFKPRGTDVAVVLDLMIHDIDVILSLVKSPVKSIDASGVAVVSTELDIANARIKFENGGVANVTASRISQNPMRKLRIFEKDAYLSLDFGAKSVDVFRLIDENTQSYGKPKGLTMKLGEIEKGDVPRSIIYEKPEVRDINPLKYELELFRDAIARDTRPVVSGEDGLRALEVAEQILLAIESNIS
ncbi:MAG: Gfo/Idh/MocA family oxidoreductase [Bacteroidota bacterium]|nr:Gfo/Idh/MocA family oxidoreductase [Bacteroidota bacterium]MDP4234524.1 Gfo/Idh/MocA family oxidoreductase [Bacteroidota bacterium]MDP4242589.1 Gfo/Idh/MocA family oxidoreductase [Bacteroidota bacterium]MDP4289419.1 Gfo/Idh/MocA family oxidoreductase [Bacteroidota bacterium]